MFLISISGILSQNFICCFRFVHYCIIPGYLARTFCFLSKIFKGSFSPRPGQQQNPLCSTIGNTESNVCVDTAISGICINTFIRFDVCYFEYKGFCSLPCRCEKEPFIVSLHNIVLEFIRNFFDLRTFWFVPEIFDPRTFWFVPEIFDPRTFWFVPEMFDPRTFWFVPEIFDPRTFWFVPEIFDPRTFWFVPDI